MEKKKRERGSGVVISFCVGLAVRVRACVHVRACVRARVAGGVFVRRRDMVKKL